MTVSILLNISCHTQITNVTISTTNIISVPFIRRDNIDRLYLNQKSQGNWLNDKKQMLSTWAMSKLGFWQFAGRVSSQSFVIRSVLINAHCSHSDNVVYKLQLIAIITSRNRISKLSFNERMNVTKESMSEIRHIRKLFCFSS